MLKIFRSFVFSLVFFGCLNLSAMLCPEGEVRAPLSQAGLNVVSTGLKKLIYMLAPGAEFCLPAGGSLAEHESVILPIFTILGVPNPANNGIVHVSLPCANVVSAFFKPSVQGSSMWTVQAIRQRVLQELQKPSKSDFQRALDQVYGEGNAGFLMDGGSETPVLVTVLVRRGSQSV